MLSGSYESVLRVWNMPTYQCIAVIENVRWRTANGIYQIDNNRVIIGGMDSITAFNIDKYIIEDKIVDKFFNTMYCFLKLRDNKTILCGNLIGRFCYYDINTKQYRITKDNKIFICAYLTNLVKIDDNTFISSCQNKRIDVWNY